MTNSSWSFFRWGKSKKEVPSTDNNPLSPEERRAQRMWKIRIMVALALPVLLETLDYTVVATAQAHIASAFNHLDLQSYIGTIYLLTSTVFLPLFASFADVYGRHSAMQVSLFLFLVGSALSTGAHNIITMLAGRGIAGIGAAGLLTVVRVILADSNSLNDNNFSSSVLATLYAVGFSAGPALGGALVNISFRWVFAINLPICAFAIVLVFVLLRHHTKGPQPPARDTDGASPQPGPIGKLLRVDWIAASLFVTGGIALLLGLNWGSNGAWSDTKVVVSLVVGGVLLTLTLIWEWLLEHRQASAARSAAKSFSAVAGGGEYPEGRSGIGGLFRADALIPLSVLSSYDVLATSFAAFTSGMVMLVIFYFVAIFMVIVSGLSPVDAGLQLIYFAPGMGGGTIGAIYMVKYLRQPRYPIILGGSVIPIGLGLISSALNDNNQGAVNGYMALLGYGIGLTFGPLSIHARFSQPQERVAVVVGLNLFFRSLGGTIGLAQCGTVLNAKVRSFFENLPPSTLSASGAGLGALSVSSITSLQQISSLPPQVQDLVKDAFRNGVRWSFISLIPWTCLSVLGCYFLSNITDSDRTLPPPAQEGAVAPPNRGGVKYENLEMQAQGGIRREYTELF